MYNLFPQNSRLLLQLAATKNRSICTTSRLLSKASDDFTPPKNEPVLDYIKDPQAKHRIELEKCLHDMQSKVHKVPIVIGHKEYHTDQVRHQLMPFEHGRKLAEFSYANQELIEKAIKSALEARKEWDLTSLEHRAQLFERAADLVSGKYRMRLNAATMLGQAKTIKQAEIDSAAELADFFRFNSFYLRKLVGWHQPRSIDKEENCIEFRSLDGFVAAIAPFNFTAIGGNLVGAPALLGNSVVWKPSDTAILSNYIIFELLKEAGLPAGVINFVPSEGLDFGRLITANSNLAGVHFTGSLNTFQWLWSEIGLNVKRYESFPRLIGECGGKNYHFVHESAHLDTVAAQTIRSAFEYSGQKCSACSRMYVPEKKWPALKAKLFEQIKQIKLGPPTDFGSYTSAVIDANAFNRIKNYLSFAQAMEHELSLVYGGKADDSVGYYVEPTIFETKNPRNRLMLEEIFGPILTVFVYSEQKLDETIELIKENPFALTGAIFAQDEQFLLNAKRKLRMSCGNMYLNDKSTGAVVGQQPFGGSKHSGTNDKAGGPYNLMRWCNQQTVKRTFKPLVKI